jgi:hypothetical protein
VRVHSVISSCHHGMGHPQVADGGTTFSMEGNILSKESRTADMGWSSIWGAGRGDHN